LEKFNNLCDSELAKHVRTLDFHPDLLPVCDKETWLSNVLRSEPFVEYQLRFLPSKEMEAYDEATRQSLSAEELDAGWAAYEKHMIGQQRWHENLPDLRTMLRLALLRLPNLCRSTVACCPSPYELRRNLFLGFAQERFLQILAREIIVPPKAWLVRLTPESLDINHVELEDGCSLAYIEAIGNRSQHYPSKQVTTLTLDFKSRQTLHKLSAASTHADDLSDGYISRRQDLLKACTATTDLTLRLREAVAHPKDDDEQAEDVREILRAAKSVRALHLEYGNFFDDEMDYLRVRSMTPQFALMPLLSNPSATYHHLKDLFLSAIVPGQALAGFLKVHSPTLKHLELRRCISDDFEPVLYTIARHLDLDHLRLYWLVDGYYTYVDGQSWKFKLGEHTTHFNFEMCLHFDGTPERSWALNRLDCVHFRKIMRTFFTAKGSLEIPSEYHTEWRDITQWKGPKFARLQQRATPQGEA
jgi:hypothetical protein